jgi:hypothetical protein
VINVCKKKTGQNENKKPDGIIGIVARSKWDVTVVNELPSYISNTMH